MYYWQIDYRKFFFEMFFVVMIFSQRKPVLFMFASIINLGLVSGFRSL